MFYQSKVVTCLFCYEFFIFVQLLISFVCVFTEKSVSDPYCADKNSSSLEDSNNNENHEACDVDQQSLKELGPKSVSSPCLNLPGEENGYDSSLDHDDDLSSEDDNDVNRGDSDVSFIFFFLLSSISKSMSCFENLQPLL